MDNKDRDTRGSHSEADWNKDKDKERRLKFLDEMDDYKIVDDDPDVRGWTVVDDQDRPVGKVDNLLVDVAKERVRYLDVDLNRDILGKGHDPLDSNDPSGVHEYEKDGEVHMIIPIGLARLDTDHKRVISDQASNNIYKQGNTHRRGQHITPEYERQVMSSLQQGNQEHRSHKTTSETTPTSDRNVDNLENTRTHDQRGSQSERQERHEVSERMEENREIRRPTSQDENQSKESDYDQNRASGRKSEEDMHQERESGSRSQEEHRSERGSGDRNGDPLKDDFYDNDYFDDRRFYGKNS